MPLLESVKSATESASSTSLREKREIPSPKWSNEMRREMNIFIGGGKKKAGPWRRIRNRGGKSS